VRLEQAGDAGEISGRDGGGGEEEEVADTLEQLQLLYNTVTLCMKKGDPNGNFSGPPARAVAAQQTLSDLRQWHLDVYWHKAQHMRQCFQGLSSQLRNNVSSSTSNNTASSTAFAAGVGKGEKKAVHEDIKAGLALLDETEAELAEFARSCNMVVNTSRFDAYVSTSPEDCYKELVAQEELPDSAFESFDEVDEFGRTVHVPSILQVSRHDITAANLTFADLSDMLKGAQEGGLRSRLGLSLSLPGVCVCACVCVCVRVCALVCVCVSIYIYIYIYTYYVHVCVCVYIHIMCIIYIIYIIYRIYNIMYIYIYIYIYVHTHTYIRRVHAASLATPCAAAVGCPVLGHGTRSGQAVL
jgi:hypothetical protein